MIRFIFGRRHRRKSARRPGALLIAPAWASSGSFEVFKSQSKVLRDLGYAVCFVAVPQYWYERDEFEACVEEYRRNWDDLHAEIRCIAKYPRWFARSRVARFDKTNQDASAAFKDAKSAFLLDIPWRIVWFAITHRRLLVVCNHYFNVPFVERAGRRAFRKLRFVLETHDIQTNQIRVRDVTLSEADYQRSIQDEKSLCLRAGEIVNISATDQIFFNSIGPSVSNTLIYPFVDRISGSSQNVVESSFLIVASWNHPNAISLNWFLDEVWARYRGSGTLRIVGNIKDAMRDLYPETFRRWQDCFIGRVHQVSHYYFTSAIVLMPTIVGEGIAIKFAEAMAFEKRVLFSPLAARGLPSEIIQPLQSCCCRDADEFLKRLGDADRLDVVEADQRSAEIYERLFSWDRYRRLYREVAARNEN